MANYRFEGTGSTQKEALKEMYADAKQTAQDHHFSLPALETLAVKYSVGIQRGERKKRVFGYQSEDYDEALTNAINAVFGEVFDKTGVPLYDSAMHPTRVIATAAYKTAPAAQGKPSGAAPPEHGGATIEELF